MPTINDVLSGLSCAFATAGGEVGLGREVRRVVHVRAGHDLACPVGGGDLVVYAARHAPVPQPHGQDRVLTGLLGAGVAGVVTDAQPKGSAVQVADDLSTPLIVISAERELDEVFGLLVRGLGVAQSLNEAESSEIRREFVDLVRAGASSSMLLQRLVEITGKAVAQHGANARVECRVHAVLQHLEPELLMRSIDASDADVQRWLMNRVDSAVHNILYLEIPQQRFVRLFAPMWIDGQFAGGVSLVGRPDQISTRDRVAVLAAVRAISSVHGRKPLQVPRPVLRRRGLILALRTASTALDQVAETACRVLAEREPVLLVASEYVGVALADDRDEPWQRRHRIEVWRTAIAEEIGEVSIGYADYCGGSAGELERALVWAGEAAIIGDQQRGPGHITSYADAQLAKFFGGNRRASDLRTVYERVIGRLAQEDPKRERGLIDTLEAYCEAVSLRATAEHLKVHRNTVLYRLKHIQETTSLDLNDGASRLLLQLGIIAGHFAGAARRRAPPADMPQSIAHFFDVAPGIRIPQSRTA